MRKILVAFDDDTAKVLSKQVNQSHYIREAVKLYNESISTDTLAGMRAAFIKLSKQMDDMSDRYVEMYEMVERMSTRMDELYNR